MPCCQRVIAPPPPFKSLQQDQQHDEAQHNHRDLRPAADIAHREPNVEHPRRQRANGKKVNRAKVVEGLH